MLKKEHCLKEGYNYIELWECKWEKIKKSNKEEYIEELKRELDIIELNNKLKLDIENTKKEIKIFNKLVYEINKSIEF